MDLSDGIILTLFVVALQAPEEADKAKHVKLQALWFDIGFMYAYDVYVSNCFKKERTVFVDLMPF